MTDRQRLIQLFDAAYETACDLVIFQASEDDAPAALTAWAEARGLSMQRYDIPDDACGHRSYLEVTPRHYVGRITVYAR